MRTTCQLLRERPAIPQQLSPLLSQPSTHAFLSGSFSPHLSHVTWICARLHAIEVMVWRRYRETVRTRGTFGLHGTEEFEIRRRVPYLSSISPSMQVKDTLGIDTKVFHTSQIAYIDVVLAGTPRLKPLLMGRLTRLVHLHIVLLSISDVSGWSIGFLPTPTRVLALS